MECVTVMVVVRDHHTEVDMMVTDHDHHTTVTNHRFPRVFPEKVFTARAQSMLPHSQQ